MSKWSMRTAIFLWIYFLLGREEKWACGDKILVALLHSLLWMLDLVGKVACSLRLYLLLFLVGPYWACLFWLLILKHIGF